METKVFDAYSQYYDLLYKDKDYDAETNYIDALIKSFSKNAGSILELGSGTGIHACLLAQIGYGVIGIDQSHTMLTKATERKNELNKPVADKLSFYEGDIRNYKSDKKVDAVISLFHVMSYMQTDADLKKALQTAKHHLKKDGLFIFDCWYGPGVLHDEPISRVKNFENELISVKRESTPEMFLEKDLVDVNFEIKIQNKNTKEETILHEKHIMHYLFTDKLNVLLEECGLKMVHAEEWMTKQPLSETSWNACYVCKLNS
jgi:SAM-dependent methyltransferase